MSLINKMLQDLEQRTDAAKSQPLSGEVRAVPAAARLSGRLAALLLLGIAALVLVWMVLPPRVSPAPVTMAAPRPAAALAPTPTAMASTPAPAVETAPAVAATPASGASDRAVNQRQPIAETKTKPPAVLAANAKVNANPVAASALAVLKKPSTVVAEEAVPDRDKTGLVSAPTPESKSQKRFNPWQQSDNLYKQAIAQVQQGRDIEAIQSLRRALEASPDNVKARHMLVGLLVARNTPDEAFALLREGLKLTPGESDFSLQLAHLRLESGDTDGAMATLEQGLQAAGEAPEYHVFYAALLQRTKRHEEAVQHYLVALRSDPAMPLWLVGIGISLQAQGKDADAAEAFRRARDGGLLTPQLLQFVEQRLSQLK